MSSLPIQDPPPHPANLAVAGEVRAAMGRRRVNQTQLARALGLSQGAMSRRLSGHVPLDVPELDRIAEILSTPVAELVAPLTGGSAGRSRCFGLVDPPEGIEQLVLVDEDGVEWNRQPELVSVAI